MILTLEQLQHMTLDNVIGRRDLARVRLATPAEIVALSREVGEGLGRGTLRDWRLVAIDVMDRPPEVVFLGTRDNCSWGTSYVRALDLDAGLARTHSGSIYNLTAAGEGEPPVEHVLHLCALLRHWGWGAALDIPEVWY